jgi:hypothetical protein
MYSSLNLILEVPPFGARGARGRGRPPGPEVNRQGTGVLERAVSLSRIWNAMFTGLKCANGLSSEKRRPAHCRLQWQWHGGPAEIDPKGRNAAGLHTGSVTWDLPSPTRDLPSPGGPRPAPIPGRLKFQKSTLQSDLENSTNPTPGTMPVVPQGDVTISVSYACTPIRYTDQRPRYGAYV